MLQVREEKRKQNRNIITTRKQTLGNNKKEKKTCSIHYVTFLAVWPTHSVNVGKRF